MILLLLLILGLLAWLIQLEVNSDGGQVQQDAVFCPSCKLTIETDWLVCPSCQQRLQISCSGCHKAVQIGQNYCPYCGMTAERSGA